MAVKMKITATVIVELAVSDDEELDAVCEDLHEQLGQIMTGNDWAGSVELSWERINEIRLVR